MNIKLITYINAFLVLLASYSVSPAIAEAAEHEQDPKAPSQWFERFVVSLNAREALAAMDAGLLTSSEYVDVLIDRMEAHPEINAFIHFDPMAIRAAAAEADVLKAQGIDLGPLHGLPVAVKDSINTNDRPTTAGTPALDGFVPASNAPVLQALLDAGAIVFGKTNLEELSSGYTTNNAFTGPTRNPYDTDRIPGGSSGGNGAALAARFVPIALGEDTAGSVRVPAALTGTMGFRPSTGRYSQSGVVPLASTLDTLGPMGRDVEDLALIDSVVTGDDEPLETVDLSELRIGVPEAFFQELLSEEVERAFEHSLTRLQAAGATLIPADIPNASLDVSGLQAFGSVFLFEVPIDLAQYLLDEGTGVSYGQVVSMIASPNVAGTFALIDSGPVSEAIYQQVIAGLVPFLRSSYLDYLDSNDLDVVVYPTTITEAPRIGQQTVEIDGQTIITTGDAFLRHSHYMPVIGGPTLSLPIGQTRRNLPAGGIDIAGRPGDDRRVLAIGKAISEVLPRIRPPREIRPRPFRFFWFPF